MLKITSDKSAWNKLKKSFLQAEKLETQVGWFEENKYGPENENLQMAQNAQWQEEGVASKNIPERPFMRVGFRDKLKSGANAASFKKIIAAVSKGDDTFKAMYKEGDSLRQTLRQVMLDWKTPGNAAKTIDLKSFDDPLIETSQLVSNVTAKVVRNK